jgi:hypothetical protein
MPAGSAGGVLGGGIARENEPEDSPCSAQARGRSPGSPSTALIERLRCGHCAATVSAITLNSELQTRREMVKGLMG